MNPPDYLESTAKLSPLQESATAETNRQYSKGFDPCDAACESEHSLAMNTFGKIDPRLTEQASD